MQYLDLDHFKQINDSRGHDTGNRVLAEAAQRGAPAGGRDGGWLGGDEFAMPCRFRRLGCRRTARAQLVGCLSEPYGREEVDVHRGFDRDGGLPARGRAVDTLLQRADAALYDAKRAGRNTFRFFSASSEATLGQRGARGFGLRLRSHLRRTAPEPDGRTSTGRA